MSDCCEKKDVRGDTVYEFLKVPQTQNTCGICEDYVDRNREKPTAVISCEGACLRGEISRRVANLICHQLAPEKTVRICQGSALSKNSGQRELVQSAEKVLFLEGCFVQCASRLFHSIPMAGKQIITYTDAYGEFDQGLFGIEDLPSHEIDLISSRAAKAITAKLL